MINEQHILSAFSNLPFQVKGVGILRSIGDKSLVVKFEDGEYNPIGLDNTCNSCYLRYGGDITYTKEELLSCSEQMYKAKTDIVLVLGTTKLKTEPLRDSILYRIGQIEGAVLKLFSENKQQILKDESIDNNTMDIIKFVFEYTFYHINPCEDVQLECDC